MTPIQRYFQINFNNLIDDSPILVGSEKKKVCVTDGTSKPLLLCSFWFLVYFAVCRSLPLKPAFWYTPILYYRDARDYVFFENSYSKLLLRNSFSKTLNIYLESEYKGPRQEAAPF